MRYIHPYSCRGFSLVEMAIVLAIVGLLLGGLMPTILTQMESQRINETRKQLNEIQQALIGYAIINGRLPCPADGTLPTIPGVANGAGEKKSTCITGANGGVLPWVTLDVNETDAWGRRFTYRVTPNFADAIDGDGSSCTVTTGVSFQVCSEGNLDMWSDAAKTTSVASKIPVVVVSHGTDGLGAYTTTGQLIPGAAGDQGENAVDNNNNDFVSHGVTSTFDDLIVWVSPNILINRMVTAGKLP